MSKREVTKFSFETHSLAVLRVVTDEMGRVIIEIEREGVTLRAPLLAKESRAGWEFSQAVWGGFK